MDADYSNKPHRAILQEIIKANPNVDIFGSASSISKRMQGGLAHELVNNNLGNLKLILLLKRLRGMIILFRLKMQLYPKSTCVFPIWTLTIKQTFIHY